MSNNDINIIQVSSIPYPDVGKEVNRSIRISADADMTREYVAGQMNSWFTQVKTLGHEMDDLVKKFGTDVYIQMEKDSEVKAALQVLVAAVVAQDPIVVPAVEQTDPEYDKAQEISEFIQRNIENLNDSFHAINTEMLDGLRDGSAIAEKIFRVEKINQTDKGMIVLDKIKKKPLQHTAFVVDPYNNVVGIANISNFNHRLPYGTFIPLSYKEGIEKIPNLLAREHFMVFTWDAQSDDPRGRSMLRAAYTPWWLKQQAVQLWIEWASKHAHPSIWATTPEGAQSVCDENGVEHSPAELLAAEGRKFANSTFAAFTYGTELHLLETKSSGEAFERLTLFCDTQIRRSILNQSLATAEASHNSRAASEVHQDTLSLQIARVKKAIAQMWRNDVFRFLTTANFGVQYQHLTPYLDLGEGTGFPPSLEEIAKILGPKAAGKWEPDEDQWMRLEKQHNLPVRRHFKGIAAPVTNEVTTNVDSGSMAKPTGDNTGDTGTDKPGTGQ